ncbi:MAG TPA: aminotransferase class V-fold PLP-dependent enzyme [Myxococcales bacterium]|jgi:selenocysteine lyase/cysteine desulfurase|nr:aminotransferase class V-fold PLP-dependent enzyme [Myxococcales bacterium]
MKRRAFLTGAAVAGAAPLLDACLAHAGTDDSRGGANGSAKPANLGDWEQVRRQFLLDYSWIHMAQFLMASHPEPVRAAIETHRRGLDTNPALYIEENVGRFEKATRDAAASYMGCDPNDLAMTDSTTMGLGIFYSGLKLERGQEILTTRHDHPAATHASLANAAARTGAPLRRIALYDKPSTADPDQMAEALAREIRPSTRIVAVTWVHSGTGVRTPIPRFAQVVAKANRGRDEKDRAILCVDGVHGFGIEDATMSSLGCDVFSAGCHKWIFGPRGTGVLCANRAGWSVSSPTIPSFDRMWRRADEMTPAAFMTPGGFHSFEHRWALAEAFKFHQAIGKARVAQRIHALNEQCKQGLAKIPRVTVHTPQSSDVSAGIICFEVAGQTPEAVVAKLQERKVIASVTPSVYEMYVPRLAPSLLTSPADVEATLRAVREIV